LGRDLHLILEAHVVLDDVRISEDRDKRAFVAEYHKAGELVGVVGRNAGARTMRYAPKDRAWPRAG
jgi:hypothetical protein